MRIGASIEGPGPSLGLVPVITPHLRLDYYSSLIRYPGGAFYFQGGSSGAAIEPFTNFMDYRLIYFDQSCTTATRVHPMEAISLRR